MICVSLGRSRHTRMIAEHKALVEQGAELIELRLDYIGRAVSLTRLLDDRPGPVVVDGPSTRGWRPVDEKRTRPLDVVAVGDRGRR